MQNYYQQQFPADLPEKVIDGAKKYKLEAYLVALEGWRRGLKLKWYKDEAEECELDKINSSTQGKFFSLSSDVRTHHFFRSRGDLVDNRAVQICKDKEVTKEYLSKKNIPIPLGKVFSINEEESIMEYASEIGYPVVIKPKAGSMGRQVYSDIKNYNELVNAYKDFVSYKKYKKLLLEKHYYGNEYRMYVVGDKVIGAVNRVPANITGDGIKTIEELINSKNKFRKSNPYLKSKPIKIDYEVKKSISNLGYDLKSVPKNEEKIFLRTISNLSSGGDPIESSDALSDEVKAIAVNALNVLPNIPHAGVDIIVDHDSPQNSVVLEVNATAEIAFHIFTLNGISKNVPKAVVDYYFPETIHNEKSTAYFDYSSIIAPLKTWATDLVEVKSAPREEIYWKKYILICRSNKNKMMKKIKRKALSNNLMGSARIISKNEIDVILGATSVSNLNSFKDQQLKTSRNSHISNVEEMEWAEPVYKLGFDIISEKRR